MISILQQVLERSKANKELICIWRYSDEDSFWCGYVLDYNDSLVKIQHFTKYGKKDGTIIVQIADIQSVDFNEDYTKAMQVVVDYSLELEKENSDEIEISEDENWTFAVLKNLEGNLSEISSVEINRSTYFTGYVLEVSETDFILQNVGKMGENEGTGIFKIEDVTGFQLNDIDNRKRAMLYKWRQASI